MVQWLKKTRQTRTDVTSQQSQQANRKRGELIAYRATLCTQMTAQLLLWVVLIAYNQSAHTTWQAVCLLAAPMALLLALWRGARKGLKASAAKYVVLLLLPNLLLDASVLTAALDGMMGEMIPSYSPHARVALICVLIFFAVVRSGNNGVAYGVACLKHLLLLLFVLATVFLGADVSTDRLWPVLGAGAGHTALTALSGAGAVWGVALLFAMPVRNESEQALAKQARKKPRFAAWAIVPLALCLIWTLWLCMARAWRPDDVLTMGERMMGLARGSDSILLTELAGLFWLLLLPCALCGCLMSAEKLTTNAFGKLPRWLPVLVFVGAAGAFAFFCDEVSISWLQPLLPWRAVVSAITAGGVWIMGKKG